MPKNKKGGARFKKGVNNSGVQIEEKIVTRSITDNEYYAKVDKPLGSGRFMLRLVLKASDHDRPILSSMSYMGILPGRLKRQKWKNFVAENDYVLIAKREFQSDDNQKVDIIMKYTPEATRKLSNMNEIPSVGDENHEDTAFCMEDETLLPNTDETQQQNAQSNWDISFDEI